MHMKASPFSFLSSCSYLSSSSFPASLFSCLLPHLIKMPSSVHWWAPSLLLSVLCCSVNRLCHIRSLNTLCHDLEAKRLIRHVWQFDCAMLDETTADDFECYASECFGLYCHHGTDLRCEGGCGYWLNSHFKCIKIFFPICSTCSL